MFPRTNRIILIDEVDHKIDRAVFGLAKRQQIKGQNKLLDSVARLLARLGSLLLMKRVRGLRVGNDGMMLEL
jgi:hypothetical protein